jgi:type II secretory pathway component PulF
MAVFTYRALNERSNLVEGTIMADTPRAARDVLRGRGLTIDAVSPQSQRLALRYWPFKRRGRHAAKRVTAIRELSTLLSAGIPLLEAVDSLARQTTGAFHTSLLLLREQIASGVGLAEAMRQQGHIYDSLSVHMVEVGENSGTLDEVLDQLANFSERSMQLKDRVTNALFYPVVVFLLSMGVGMFLMTVVVPMLLDNLLEAGKTIPWPTLVLKTVSDLVRSHGLEITAVFGLAVAAALIAVRTGPGRRAWHRLLLRIPVIGPMARKQEIARIALVVATLIKSGVVLLQALEIAGRATKNCILREALEEGQQAIHTGKDIGEALEETGQIPATVVQIFSVGQQSGRLEEMLERLADNYDRQVATLSLRLATLLEPVLIVGLALFVGFILFATVLPILEAGNVL